MKKVLSMTIFTLFISFNGFAQISYGNFETLNPDSTIRYWTLCAQVISIDTSNVPDSIIVDGPLLQYSTNANSGNYALQLQNHWNYTQNTPYMNGCAFLDLDTNKIMYNGIRFVELNDKPTSFYLYYLYQPQLFNDDTSTAIVKLYNSNMQQIGEGKIQMWDVLWTYQLKSIPITYFSNDSVAFYSIDIKVSPLHVGNRLLVDDLAFDYTPLSVATNPENVESIIYPNPIKDIVNINGKNISKVEIFNSIGQPLLSTSETNININSIPKGIYFLKIYYDKNIEVRKIIKE